MAEWSDFSHTMTRGDDETLPFAVTNTNTEGQTVPEPLGDYQEIWLAAKRKPTDADDDAVFLVTLTDGDIVLMDADGGSLEVYLVPAHTTDLTNERTYHLYAGLKAKNSAGKIITLAQGRLAVRPRLPDATS